MTGLPYRTDKAVFVLSQMILRATGGKIIINAKRFGLEWQNKAPLEQQDSNIAKL